MYPTKHHNFFNLYYFQQTQYFTFLEICLEFLFMRKQRAGTMFQSVIIKICSLSFLCKVVGGSFVIRGHLAEQLNQGTTHHDQSISYCHHPW